MLSDKRTDNVICSGRLKAHYQTSLVHALVTPPFILREYIRRYCVYQYHVMQMMLANVSLPPTIKGASLQEYFYGHYSYLNRLWLTQDISI